MLVIIAYSAPAGSPPWPEQGRHQGEFHMIIAFLTALAPTFLSAGFHVLAGEHKWRRADNICANRGREDC